MPAGIAATRARVAAQVRLERGPGGAQPVGVAGAPVGAAREAPVELGLDERGDVDAVDEQRRLSPSESHGASMSSPWTSTPRITAPDRSAPTNRAPRRLTSTNCAPVRSSDRVNVAMTTASRWVVERKSPAPPRGSGL